MIVDVSTITYPVHPSIVSATPTIGGGATMDLNGTGQYMAWVNYARSTFTADRFFFRINAAATGCTALVRFETVDTSTGLPTGTLIHANASQSVVIGTGAADYTVTFPGSFTVARGTIYAVVIAQSSGTPSGVNWAIFSDDNEGTYFPYAIDMDATAGFRDSLAPLGGIGLSGGGALPVRHLWPINAVSTETFGSGATPNNRGNKIILAARMRVSGAWVWLDQDGPSFTRLYGEDGTTVLASAEGFTNLPPTTAQAVTYLDFGQSVALSPGTYYLAVQPTSATALSIYSCTFPSSGWRSGSPMGGDSMEYVTCNGAPSGVGSWSTTGTKQAFMGLLVDGLDDGQSNVAVAFST